MHFTTIFTPVALALAVAAQNSFTINTPVSPQSCQPLLITWAGGVPPYLLSLVDGNNPSGPSTQDLGSQTGTTFTWKVNVDASKIGLKLIDSTGAIANTSPFDVLAGSDKSCIGQAASGASSAPAAGATSAAAPAAGASSAAAPGSSKAASASGSAAPATSSAAKPNGASTNVANAGVASLFGAALFAILA
jgi:hypothetical protein